MSIPTIDAPPTAPNRATMSSSVFATAADTFVAWLSTLVSQANATVAGINSAVAQIALDLTSTSNSATAAAASATSAATSATSAASSATTAAGYANTALNAPGTSATDTSTSITIGTGTKNFTIQTGKLFQPGQNLTAAATSSPTNQMTGIVISYNSGTGALQLSVATVNGSGTFSSWTLSIAAVASGVTFGTTAGTAAQGNDSRIVNAVQNTRQVTGGGLVTGGGDLSTDRTLTVTAAGASDNWAGSSTSKAVTPKSLADAAAFQSLTDAATIAVDGSLGLNFQVTLGGNRTLGNPTNLKQGYSGVIKVVQDATGNRTLSYGSAWKFPGGAPSLSTSANAVDLISYVVVDAVTPVIYASLAKGMG